MPGTPMRASYTNMPRFRPASKRLSNTNSFKTTRCDNTAYVNDPRRTSTQDIQRARATFPEALKVDEIESELKPETSSLSKLSEEGDQEFLPSKFAYTYDTASREMLTKYIGLPALPELKEFHETPSTKIVAVVENNSWKRLVLNDSVPRLMTNSVLDKINRNQSDRAYFDKISNTLPSCFSGDEAPLNTDERLAICRQTGLIPSDLPYVESALQRDVSIQNPFNAEYNAKTAYYGKIDPNEHDDITAELYEKMAREHPTLDAWERLKMAISLPEVQHAFEPIDRVAIWPAAIAAQLLHFVNTPEKICNILEHAKGDTDFLERIAKLDCLRDNKKFHSLGKFRIPLAIKEDITILLHNWQQAGQDMPVDEFQHSHHNTFASCVLQGEVEHFIYTGSVVSSTVKDAEAEQKNSFKTWDSWYSRSKADPENFDLFEKSDEAFYADFLNKLDGFELDDAALILFSLRAVFQEQVMTPVHDGILLPRVEKLQIAKSMPEAKKTALNQLKRHLVDLLRLSASNQIKTPADKTFHVNCISDNLSSLLDWQYPTGPDSQRKSREQVVRASQFHVLEQKNMLIRKAERPKGILKLNRPVESNEKTDQTSSFVDKFQAGESYVLEGNIVHKFVCKEPSLTVLVRKGAIEDNVELRRVPNAFKSATSTKSGFTKDYNPWKKTTENMLNSGKVDHDYVIAHITEIQESLKKLVSHNSN